MEREITQSLRAKMDVFNGHIGCVWKKKKLSGMSNVDPLGKTG